MKHLFYFMGKSASGKDSILSAVLADENLHMKEIVPYTTRPIRAGEKEGDPYHFIDDDTATAYEKAGKVVEMRAYMTVHGIWKYMMVDDGSLDFSRNNYAAVGTLEAYPHVRDHFPEGVVVPVYISVETGERLRRAVHREQQQEAPKYAELCRRFLADEEDFNREHLQEAGMLLPDGTVKNAVENDDFARCLQKVKALIEAYRQK